MQRANLLRRRQQIKQTASRQKHEILESFYKMKVTKKFELPRHIASSIIVEGPRSASAMHTRSLTKVDDLSTSNSRMADKAPKTSRRPISASTRRPRSAASTSSHRPMTSRDHRSPIDTDEYGGPHSADDIHQNREETTDEKRSDAINELRRQQNEELLKVLEEEHHAEEQRKHLLRQASADRRERVRMEQMFDKERGLASERIMQLTDRHERALAAKMDELDER